jgi:PadR family transcriptional regulator, regulatory protein AphA
MILECALLGFLGKGPKTGYELQKKIERTINYFWTSTQSQVYRTLKKMEQDALIVSTIHYQDEKPNKKIYSITRKGKEELKQWLSTPIKIPSHRNPFLVQLFFSGRSNKKRIKLNLLHYKKEMEERVAFLTSPETKHMAKSGTSTIERFIYTSLVNNGIHVLQSEIDWVDQTLQELENL